MTDKEQQRSVYAQAQQPADQPHAIEQPALLHDVNTKSICKDFPNNPSIIANSNFNARATADLLRKTLKAIACDKEMVSQTLITYNNAQRQEIVHVFNQMHGKDIVKELKSELRGYEDLISALMDCPEIYDAEQLHFAMQGRGTKEQIAIEILSSRTNKQIHDIKKAYRKNYGTVLENDLLGGTSGYFRRLLVSMCSGSRDELMHNTNVAKAAEDARRMCRAGEPCLGADEIAFNSILAAQNFAQLQLLFTEYEKQHGHPIEKAMRKEFSGDICEANLSLVKSIRNRPSYFAELIHKAVKGLGTRDNDLIRLVVTRSEIDMADIRKEYQQMYGTSLEAAIADDCSRAYKHVLIAIVKGNIVKK